MSEPKPLTQEEAATREDLATRAFLEHEETYVCGVTLRAVTLASLTLLQQTRNEFLSPRGPAHPETGAPTVENELFAALAFGYLHAAPLPEVRRAAFSESFFREQVLAWGDALPPEALPRLVSEIERRLAQINGLAFSVQQKPSEGASGPTPPPNS